MKLGLALAGLACWILSQGAYGTSQAHVSTIGGICFAHGSQKLSDDSKKLLTQIVRAQNLDLEVVVVIGYDDGQSARAKHQKSQDLGMLRAQKVKAFLAEELKLAEQNRIYVDARPYSAWPDTIHRKFRRGNVKLPCVEATQPPSPLVIEVIGACRPQSVCRPMRCDGSGCEEIRP